jgi:hypothetical protein
VCRLTGSKGHGLDVEDDDGDALLLEELDDAGADARSAASDEDNLTRPVILVRDPIVARLLSQPLAGGARDGEVEEGPEPAEGGGVEDGEVLALLCEAGEQQDGQKKSRVEGGVANNLKHRVGAEALAGDETLVHRHLQSSCCWLK